jgi:hypothetical protein
MRESPKKRDDDRIQEEYSEIVETNYEEIRRIRERDFTKIN